MKLKHLQIGRAGRYLLLLLMLPLMAAKAYAYDFSAVCSTGQTLYYNITDNESHLVELTCPGTNDYPWNGYTEPEGHISIPSTVTYNDVEYTVSAIGDYAFYECYDLTGSLTIPNSVIEIGEDAFYYCNGFADSLIIGNSVTEIGDYAFSGCSGFTGSLTIPNSVTSIGKCAFAGCYGFTGSLTIPDSVKSIGESTFSHCRGFTGSLTIPNSVTSIGEHAFYFCGFMGSLTIGNSVTSIGMGAFADCSHFQSLQVEALNPPIIGSITFKNFDKTIPVTVPCGSQSAYQSALYWSEFTNYQEEIFFTLSVSSANDDMGSATITQQPDCINDAIVTATPNQGFVFVNWTKNGEVVSTEAIYTFTLTENTVLVANFRQGTGVEENDAASSANFAYFSNGELVISCEGKNTLHIIDMMGRVLCSQTINGGCRICTNWMTAGTYILNLNGMTQKIVVK